MFAINALLAGTLALASLRLFGKRRQRNLMYWLATPQQDPFSEGAVGERRLAAIEKQVNQNYILASYSLTLSLFAVLIYTPAGWLSIPLTLLSALPMFERTLDQLTSRARINWDLLGTTAISLSILADNFLMASLLQWLLVVNEQMALRLSRRFKTYIDPNAMPDLYYLNEIWSNLRQEMWRQRGEMITLDPSQVSSRSSQP